jgi:hypothetical protein
LVIFKHIDNDSANAEFSLCGKYRYRLTIKKNEATGDKNLCVVMQNPSVANSEIADRSAQFLEKLIFLEGYQEFKHVRRIIIVNQFAYVQTNDFNGSEEHIGPENDRYLGEAITESDIILIAWGASNRYKVRQRAVNGFLNSNQGKQVFQTKTHPSRGTYVDFIKPYSI